MTTTRHTIELDDTDTITLRAALALLQAGVSSFSVQ